MPRSNGRQVYTPRVEIQRMRWNWHIKGRRNLARKRRRGEEKRKTTALLFVMTWDGSNVTLGVPDLLSTLKAIR